MVWTASTQTNITGYKIYYGTVSGQYGTPIDVGNRTSYTLSGLAAGTYYIVVSAYDSSGLESIPSNEIIAVVSVVGGDTTPPVITGISASGVTSAAATILWTTDEQSDSQVEYGITTAYGFVTAPDPTLVTAHSQALGNLLPGTGYHFRVKSQDAAGNTSVSGDFTFATGAATNLPPVITGVSTSAVTAVSAMVIWTTDKPSDTQVDFGTTTAYGSTTPLNTAAVTAHSQGLGGLTANTTYHYRVKSRDSAGNLTASGDFTLTTTADTTPPVITGVSASGVTLNSATIAWATDEQSDTQVDYGTTTAYGSVTPLNAALLTAHTQGLSGLNPNTTYHYRVKSKDAAGNLAASGDFTFVTTGDTTPPVITGVSSSGVTVTSATVSWSTDEPSDTQVDYGTTTAYGSVTPLNAALGTTHSQGLTGLNANTTYHYRVKSKDAAGNLATSADFTFVTTADTTPPVITGVSSSSITASSANVGWATDEQSDTQVEYGTTTAYGSATTLNATRVTSHSQGLTALNASTTYHYRVKSKDAAGNLGTSGDFTFTTAADTTPPVISSVASSGVTGTAAAIRWLTNEGADSQIQYGTTTSYGSTTTLDPAMLTSHSQNLTGLTGNTTYHYRVKSKDAAGNLATSPDFTFKTASPLNTGLSVAYAFDEGTGSTTTDFSANANTGTLVNVSWTKGKFGNALSFNGKNCYVTTPGVGLPAMNAAQTIAFWFNFDSNQKTSSTLPIVSLGNAQQLSIQPGYKDSQAGVWQNPGSWLVAGTQPSVRVWHHIAYTYDGQIHRLYVDGVEVSTSTIAPTAGAATSLQIGRIAGGSDFLKGNLDELRIYTRALTPVEIQSLMTVATGSAP